MSTACWRFPIYSQSFVYQELAQLVRHGYDLRFLYSEPEPNDKLPAQFDAIWRGRRRMFLNPDDYDRDFEWFRRRTPERVTALLRALCDASGLPEAELRRHYHVQQSFSFARVVEAFRPRYLHSYFFYEGTLFTYVASSLLNIPRGVSCYSDHLLRDYELKVVPLHLGHCSIVIATAQRIKEELLAIAPHLDPDTVIVKPNAVNTLHFPVRERGDPGPGQPFRLLCVARFDPKKGLTTLVEAVRLLRDRGHDVEAHLVGGVDLDQKVSVEYGRTLARTIADLGLQSVIHLEGSRPESEVRAFLERSHLFVAPFVEMASGDKDGIPTTILEAMSTGMPVVATDAGAIPEILTDGIDGVRVPQRDPAALAATVAALMADPDRRARLGARAAEMVRRRFDVEASEHVFHTALRRLLASRR